MKTRFPQFARDSRDEIWNDVASFFSNKSSFEYNIRKLQALSIPIVNLTAIHNNSVVSKRDYSEENSLMSQLYYAVGVKPILTSNL